MTLPPSTTLRAFSRRIAVFSAAFLALVAGGVWWWSAHGADLDSIERIVRQRYPGMKQISTSELAEWLHSGKPKPLLLDVREPAEFAVSHLEGARRVSPDAEVSVVKDVPKETPIVTYCSVGWRSSGFAKKLQEAGYTNVQNLEGSIFRWANEDRPMLKDGKPAEKVHPYSDYWSRLVKPERRAPVK